MRVLQLGPVPPPHGGVQANFSAIHERLRERGEESLLVSITRSEKISEEPNVYHPRSAAQLVKLLFTLRPDIIHLHFGGDFTARLAGLALVGSLVPRAKKVLTFHSGGFASSELGKAASPNSLRGLAVRGLDRIIVVNEEMVELFQRYGVKKEKISLILPFVLRQPDPSVKVPENLLTFVEKHNPLLFTASWLEPHYDLPLQIKVLQLLKEKYPNAGLLIAGGGVQENELRQMIAATNCAESILLAGDVPHKVVLHLIKRADVLLRTTHFDGDAISIREALHLGTPVVATDTGMRPNGVRLFKIGDLADLQRAIAAQLAEGRLAADSSGDGWENIDAVLQIYRDLLQTKQTDGKEPVHLIENLKP
jgi:glycogen synthase